MFSIWKDSPRLEACPPKPTLHDSNQEGQPKSRSMSGGASHPQPFRQVTTTAAMEEFDQSIQASSSTHQGITYPVRAIPYSDVDLPPPPQKSCQKVDVFALV